MPNAPERLQRALARIDEKNAEDPRVIESNGTRTTEERLYSERMTAWLARIEPNASEALQLAVRAQHIGRWMIPRDRYPRDRPGYLRWRSELSKMHADLAEEILLATGYDTKTIERVRTMLVKKGYKTDPEVQTLEDVACLVFLEHYFVPFLPQQDDEKLIEIVRKTWRKMSERGHTHALTLSLPAHARSIVERALDANP